MSTITIIGASGNVGTQLVAEALRRSHTVTAVARDPSNLGQHAGLELKSVDFHDAKALQAAVTGYDAVVTSVRFEGLRPSTIIEPIKAARVARLLVVGGAASLNMAPGQRLLDSPHFPAQYKAEASAAAAFLEALRQEPKLEWTFISPSAEFVNGKRTGSFRIGKDDLLTDVNGRSWISYQDFAIALFDELEHPVHLRQRFTVGY
jgi:putative NADH-flavin reductase